MGIKKNKSLHNVIFAYVKLNLQFLTFGSVRFPKEEARVEPGLMYTYQGRGKKTNMIARLQMK